MPSLFVRERAFFTQAKYCRLDDIFLTKIEFTKSCRMQPKTTAGILYILSQLCLANCIMCETMELCTIITDFIVISCI